MHRSASEIPTQTLLTASGRKISCGSINKNGAHTIRHKTEKRKTGSVLLRGENIFRRKFNFRMHFS